MRWLTNAVKGLASNEACSYYFARTDKTQVFQLCFDTSNMLDLKQALSTSTSSGAA